MTQVWIAGMARPLPPVIQGIALLGYPEWVPPDQAFALLDAAFDAGCTAFETARAYNMGWSERLLGEWMRARGNREQVTIITKGCTPRERVSADNLTADLTESLEALGVDHVDLYLLHYDNPAVPTEELVERLDQHRREGRYPAFGVANWSHERIEEANERAKAKGAAPIAASSAQLSLAVPIKPTWEHAVTIGGPNARGARGWYTHAQMPVLAWSSLALGFFSGKYGPTSAPRSERLIERWCSRTFLTPDNYLRLERATLLAKERGVTAAQIALAYLLHLPFPVVPIVAANTPARVRENMATVDIALSAEEMAWLSLERDQR
jgi:aryl-alcohol dehydrogenase-like predicted oxidoreductase